MPLLNSVCCACAVQVHEIVKGIFNKDPSRGVNPDEVVAMGAAIQVSCRVLGGQGFRGQSFGSVCYT
jgi:hypothetical protein